MWVAFACACVGCLHKCIITPHTDTAYIKYIKYRNLYNNLKRIAKINYYSALFQTYQNDIRKTWKSLRNIIGTQNDKSNIPQIFTVNKKNN